MSATDQPTANRLSYAQLRRAYNRRTRRIDQIWARAVVQAQWTDPEGKRHIQQGEGHLIVRKPSDLALEIGKLGHTILWLGSNEMRYWMFNLEPPGDQPSTALVGWHGEEKREREVGKRSVEIPLLYTSDPNDTAVISVSVAVEMPLPIQPARLIQFLGITPLPPKSPSVRMDFHPNDGLYVVRWPAEQDAREEGGPVWRVRIDARTLRPQQIALIDPGPRPRIIARASFSRWEQLEQRNVPPGGRPDVPTHIELRIPRRQARIELFLEEPTSGVGRDRVRDAQFDFQTLLRVFEPERVRRIVPPGSSARARRAGE